MTKPASETRSDPAIPQGDVARCSLCLGVVPAGQPPRWRKDGLDIVECPSCGVVFRRELPSRAELDEIYSESYFLRPADDLSGQGYADYVSDEEVHRVNARRRLDRLERLIRPGRLLDVGCAAGFFVDEANRCGWDAHGIDVSPAMAAWAQARHGLDVKTGTFQSESFESASYECVTMWDYIEHSVDPAGDLAKAFDLLAPGGVLSLSTGDIASPLARVSGRRWHLLTPRHHNFFFSGRTIRGALERAGFSIVSLRHPASHFTVRYLIHKLATTAPGGAVFPRLAERLGRGRIGALTLPLNLGDVMEVFARKVSTRRG